MVKNSFIEIAMNDLSQNLQNVWSALAKVSGGNGASIMFIGAKSGDGTSMCARGFAKLCENRATKSVWLLDLDFFADGQFNFFNRGKESWNGPFDMTFGQTPFWRAVPRSTDGNQGFRSIVGYNLKGTKLYVSRFIKASLKPGQTLQIGPSPAYWAKVCEKIDVTIIDAPALERSRAGLALVSQIDAVVLVIDGENGDPRDSMVLRDEILSRGGNCIGVVVVNSNKKSKKRAAF